MGPDLGGTDGGLTVASEIYMTQPNAISYVEQLYAKHGVTETRNLVYLLNDQRRGRSPVSIPFVKLKGRILYRATDLKDWVLGEIERERKRHSGIYEIEGDTEVERLLKLAASLTVH